MFGTAAVDGGSHTAPRDDRDGFVAGAQSRARVKLIANDFFGAPSGLDERRGGR